MLLFCHQNASCCMHEINCNCSSWPDNARCSLTFLGQGIGINIWLPILDLNSFAKNRWNRESGIDPSLMKNKNYSIIWKLTNLKRFGSIKHCTTTKRFHAERESGMLADLGLSSVGLYVILTVCTSKLSLSLAEAR